VKTAQYLLRFSSILGRMLRVQAPSAALMKTEKGPAKFLATIGVMMIIAAVLVAFDLWPWQSLSECTHDH